MRRAAFLAALFFLVSITLEPFPWPHGEETGTSAGQERPRNPAQSVAIEGYRRTFHEHGVVFCALATQSQACGALLHANRVGFSYATDPSPMTGLVAELAWAGLGVDPCLRLEYPQPEGRSPSYATNGARDASSVEGSSPLRLQIESDQGDLPLFPSYEVIEFAVAPCSTSVFWKEEFKLHLAFFYNESPIPLGFTQLPS